jgi:hypothetical protein
MATEVAEALEAATMSDRVVLEGGCCCGGTVVGGGALGGEGGLSGREGCAGARVGAVLLGGSNADTARGAA